MKKKLYFIVASIILFLLFLKPLVKNNNTKDEVEFEEIMQQILEENRDSINIFFEKYPEGLRWIQLSFFDFTKDGCKEIILSKEYVETSAVISHNYVYDCYGNKLLEFVSEDITSMGIFYDEDNSLYYLENKLHISAHQDMALYEEIAVSENMEITISFIEWDARDGRARADNQEDGYFVFDSFTRYEEQAIWDQDMDGILEILNKKEAKGTNEKLKQYVSKLEQLKKSKVEPYGSMYDWEIGMKLAE